MTPKTIHLAAQNDILYLIDRKPCSGGSDCPLVEDDENSADGVLAKIYDSGKEGAALGRAIERRYNLHDALVEMLRRWGSPDGPNTLGEFMELRVQTAAILAKVDQKEGR